jgi:DNA ligase-1
MEVKFSTSILESETSRGTKKFWQGHVGSDGSDWYTYTSFWQETKDGLSKKQIGEPTLIVGKNKGRANETTNEEQAYSELKTLTNKQIDKGYHEEGKVSTGLPLPMACLKLKDAKHRLTGKLVVQPKLDGLRAIYYNDGKEKKMWSRKGKLMIPQIYHHLHFDTEGYKIDGELMLPRPKFSFQHTMSATKRFQLNLSPLLQYHVFDILDESGTIPFRERYKIARRLVEKANNPNVLLVSTFKVDDLDGVMEHQDKFVEMGYEGIIVRMVDGKYKMENHGRSHEIQKFKYFYDKEFVIVGMEDGRGKNAGVAKYICKTETGTLFGVDFNGTVEERKEMFQNQEKYIGKMLTIRYQEFTDDGVTPKFGKGINIRDYDLQGGSQDE